MSEFNTHMVYFFHSHVCVKCCKRARNFLGGWVRANKSLLDCESMQSQWVGSITSRCSGNEPALLPEKTVGRVD